MDGTRSRISACINRKIPVRTIINLAASEHFHMNNIHCMQWIIVWFIQYLFYCHSAWRWGEKDLSQLEEPKDEFPMTLECADTGQVKKKKKTPNLWVYAQLSSLVMKLSDNVKLPEISGCNTIGVQQSRTSHISHKWTAEREAFALMKLLCEC